METRNIAAGENPAVKTGRRARHIKSLEPIFFLAVLLLGFCLLASRMGVSNMLNTLMNTAYGLLVDTAFYIMAIAVITGALSALFAEFGVIDLLNKVLSPLMKPLYGLPGAAALGVVTTYLSDNPAILTLADDPHFRSCCKKYQLPALTNIGTAFGMGLIVTTFMLSLNKTVGAGLGLAVLVGNLAAMLGSVVSTRLMLHFTKKQFGKEAPAEVLSAEAADKTAEEKQDRLGIRVMNAMLNGGKSGVKLGLGIIPGVLIICTLVLMLTNAAPAEGFTGAAYEGVGLLPMLANKIGFLLKPLFGFASGDCIAVPITALGSAGAAIGLVPQLLSTGAASVHDIAVFTAMCMCFSGYLSTHVSMMDALNCRSLTGKAILSHTVGGLVAGIAANWLFLGLSALLAL